MPLFKVRTHNHPKKVCVDAASIDDITSKATKKLKITSNQSFQVNILIFHCS